MRMNDESEVSAEASMFQRFNDLDFELHCFEQRKTGFQCFGTFSTLF
jgi:hypothetical protein